jgi:Tol biopolymer transport system component
MTLSPGTRLGPYEVSAPLGAGGMGEVYRAKDTRLGREVAVKVLPSHLSDNPEVRARFEREARAVSSLNHPHICTLHDIGREGNVDYLVMELVDGETLAQRLAKGALPIAEVLRIGAQIADALDRAHRAGIIHRDLKPGNVMLAKSGTKLMDFGLARATGLAGPGDGSSLTMAALSQSPTIAAPLTAEGTIVGTFQYMAPEQLDGREADARSDLWSLGCVLYEMTTGRRAFEGKSQASLISAIMRDVPQPLGELVPISPPALDRLVGAMLAKDPEDRVQTAHDVKLQLRWAAEGGAASVSMIAPTFQAQAAQPARRRTSPAPWAVAAVCLLAAGFFAWRALHGGGGGGGSTAGGGVHAAILPPTGVVFSSSTDSPMPLALSPDGKLVAFCARNGEGPDMLWVRSINANDARPIPGTEDAEGPFFSPDGRSLGFFAGERLKRVDAVGGAVITLAEDIDARGGSWSSTGVILYGSTALGPLLQVKDDGGKITAATVLDSLRDESTHRYPWFLPDGKRFLYLARRSGAGAGREPAIIMGELGSTKRTHVLEVASNVAFASGHLLYIREGVLVAQRFDPGSGAVAGSAVPLIDDARMDERFSRGVFAVSANGVLACMTGHNQTRTQLMWLDRAGHELGEIGEPADYTYGGTPELSPDDKRAVIPIANRERGTSDVWIIDLGSGRRTRLTVDQYDHPAAIWHPAGDRILASNNRNSSASSSIDEISTDGRLLRSVSLNESGFLWPRSVSPDGRDLLFDNPESASRTSRGLAMIPLAGGAPTTLVETGISAQSDAQFSPDGRYYAYESIESGRREVYVAARAGGGKWQVSQSGGSEARWRADGRELFYVDKDNVIVAVQVDPAAPSFSAGSSTKLFPFHGAGGLWRYDVSADGSRMLVTRALQEDLASPVTLITGWTAKVEGK